MQTHKTICLWLTTSILLFVTGFATAQAFNAASDFSPTANPNGDWSYGWSQSRGSGFNLLPQTMNNCGYGVYTGTSLCEVFWAGSGICCFALTPGVFHNGNGEDIKAGTAVVPKGAIGLHPGPHGENAVVRWTAPAAGTYYVSGFFFGVDTIGTTTDVAILHNGTQLFAGNVSGFYQYSPSMPASNGTSPTQAYHGLVTVAVGETIDFTVGYGQNGNYFNDSTGLEAIISTPTRPNDWLVAYNQGTSLDRVDYWNWNGPTIHELVLYSNKIQGVWYSSQDVPYSEMSTYQDLAGFSNQRGIHKYYNSPDGHVHHLLGTAVNEDVTLTTGAPLNVGLLTAFSDNQGEHVDYMGSVQTPLGGRFDGHIHELLWWNGSWSHTDLFTANPSGACAIAGGGIASYSGTSEVVNYVSAGGHVCQLAGGYIRKVVCLAGGCRLSNIPAFTPSDLTSLAGGTLANPGSSLTGFSDANGQHVFYVGTDQHVHHLLWNGSAENNQDLTVYFAWTGTGWEQAALPLTNSLTSFSNTYGEHVYYVGMDQHVYQINLTASDATTDLTALTGGALANPWVEGVCNPGTTLASIASDAWGREDVFYTGADLRIHGFQYPSVPGVTNTWTKADLDNGPTIGFYCQPQ